ncbi:MAG: hypothetical protein A2048_08750 [Deltaproteobacteria bacterium GWA2_45_12]|nr:MAG: hypothetical protein A2048_08750 [Deltaproteobacteria bacterium GWA2_45_12]
MGLKENASFLRFVTMGALGTRHAWKVLESKGHNIVELERYSSSNKIWATKIKRLRLPDLLCVNCGTRFEVRAKSKLEIKMSHAQSNPDRYWDSGLRDEDIVIFLLCRPDEEITTSRPINAFSVQSLRASQSKAKLGPPKSASEGAERDLQWPSWVPNYAGTIEQAEEFLKVKYDIGRNYSYRLKGKLCYFPIGYKFSAEDQIACGAPTKQVDLKCRGKTWNINLDSSQILPDLYAAIKAIDKDNFLSNYDMLKILLNNADLRLKLEVAGILFKYANDPIALKILLSSTAIGNDENAQWSMESVFIFSEIGSQTAIELLTKIAADSNHVEVRAAAVWNLGELKSNIDNVIPSLSDKETNVKNHAIISLSKCINGPEETQKLLSLIKNQPSLQSAVCEALILGKRTCINSVLDSLNSDSENVARCCFIILCRSDFKQVHQTSSWEKTTHGSLKYIDWYWNWREESIWSNDLNRQDLILLTKQFGNIWH